MIQNLAYYKGGWLLLKDINITTDVSKSNAKVANIRKCVDPTIVGTQLYGIRTNPKDPSGLRQPDRIIMK